MASDLARDFTPFFSVVVPAYNRASFLPPLISSLTSQTFDSFELIIVDDGSTDETRDIVTHFSLSDPRIIYKFQVNSERGAARNHGISHARGQWISFLDSDDMYMPDHLSTLYDYITNFSPEGIVAFRYLIKHESGLFTNGVNNLPSGSIDPSVLLKGNPFACNFSIKNSSNLSFFVEHKSLMSMEDWIFLLTNTRHSSLHLLPRSTVVFSYHPGRSMNDNKHVVEARLNALWFLMSESIVKPSEFSVVSAYSFLFCAIHSYLDGRRKQALMFYSLAARLSLTVFLRIDLFIKFVFGRSIVIFLRSRFLRLFRPF